MTDKEQENGEEGRLELPETAQDKYQEPAFFEAHLEEFGETFTRPKNTDEFVEIVEKHHLLVLDGSHKIIDTSALARHVAWYVNENLKNKSVNTLVKEWYRSSNFQKLFISVEEQTTDKPAIFILPRIEPQHVNYDLFPLQQTAINKGHFVIISTEISFKRWGLDESKKELFWREFLPDDPIFTTEDLSNVLLHKLSIAQKNSVLPEELSKINFNPQKPLIEDLFFKTIAEELRTPDNIAFFVQLLCNEQSVNKRRVQELIQVAQDNKRMLHELYHHTLPDMREKLLALGLSLFDGIFDDQFFVALEIVIEKVWQRRDPSLRAPDYCDLDTLQNFFSFVKTKDGIQIVCRIPEQRRKLFEAVWKTHRRQILSTLPILTQLLKNSVLGRDYNTELYGTGIRRQLIRQVIGETLSDISRISFNAIQNVLLQLAADPAMEVQEVAAIVLARLRKYDKSDVLFEKLQRWQHEAQFRDIIKTLLEGSDKKTRQNPEAHIRATIALTTSFASLYDPPNELHPKLCDLLESLATDPNSFVKDRFRHHTLRFVIWQHLEQLRDSGILRNMTQQIALIGSLATHLAYVYHNKNSIEVTKTLTLWHEEGVQVLHRLNHDKNQREKLLATVALTYGEILRYGKEKGPLDNKTLFSKLRDILAKEKQSFLVRQAVVMAVTRQAHQQFEEFQVFLLDVLSHFQENEYNEIVEILTDIYLEERSNQEDGEEIIEINGRQYPIWLDKKQPITMIEKTLLDWVKLTNNPAAQQIASRAFIDFASKLEQFVSNAIIKIKKEREKEAESIDTEEKSIQGRYSQFNPYVTKVIPFLVTVSKLSLQHYSVVRGLFPEILLQHKYVRNRMNFVLNNWENVLEDKEINTITKLLKNALFVYENPWLPLLIIGVLFLIIVF